MDNDKTSKEIIPIEERIFSKSNPSYASSITKPMDNQLITLTETSTDRYLLAVLPKDAENIAIADHDDILFIEYFNPRWEGIKIGDGENWMRFKLLGILGKTITEDIAREIVESSTYYKSHYQYEQYLDYVNKSMCLESALESLTSLVESKGIDTNNKIVLIKSEI
jgi:hypothetical protein